MKRIALLAIALMISTSGWLSLYGQAPAGFSYQSVIRDAAGSPLTKKAMQMRFSILTGSVTGTSVYTETQSISSNEQGLIATTIGIGSPTVGTFAAIDWGSGSFFLKVEVDLNTGSGYILSGVTQLMSVPYALYAGKAGGNVWTNNQGMVYLTTPGNVGIGTTTPTGALEVKGSSTDPNVPLFEVKDKNGNPIFSVYPTGVEIIYDETAPTRGAKGGFAVSGRNSTRAVNDILRVTTDSTTVYVSNPSGRPAKGGFAVSGRNSTRAITGNILRVTPDSTRIYTADPIKGFGVGHMGAKAVENYLRLNPVNYFIGHNAGIAIQKGQYNVFLGYEAGRNTTGYHQDMEPTDGDNNIFIGYQSGYGNTVGEQNVYIGAFSGKGNGNGIENTFVGSYTGYMNTGYGNTFLGSRAGGSGQANSGYRNTFVGCYAGQSNTTGSDNVFIGRECGSANSTGNDNVFIGHLAGLSNTAGVGNVFIGKGAGQGTLGSNKLIIANNANESLVTGDFAAKKFHINGDLTATTVNAPSDQRLKKNISPIPDALTRVMKLRGVNFEWKDTTFKGKQIGFIAQEVEKVVPEVVSYLKDKDTYTMQYAPVTALLVEAMKEQQKTIEQLKAENDALKKQVAEIKQLVLDMKK